MASANPAQSNLIVFAGEDACRDWLISHPGESEVNKEALSGADTIQVVNLHRDLAIGDPVVFVFDNRSYRAIVRTATSKGQDAGFKYRVIPVQAISECIPKGAIMLIPKDVRDTSLYDYEVRRGYYVEGAADNLISGTTVTALDTTVGGTGDANKRGILTTTIPRSATSGMDITLTNFNRQTLDVWVRATLPQLTLDGEGHNHPYRHQLTEITSAGLRSPFWQGVVVVGSSVTTASNDGGGS